MFVVVVLRVVVVVLIGSEVQPDPSNSPPEPPPPNCNKIALFRHQLMEDEIPGKETQRENGKW